MFAAAAQHRSKKHQCHRIWDSRAAGRRRRTIHTPPWPHNQATPRSTLHASPPPAQADCPGAAGACWTLFCTHHTCPAPETCAGVHIRDLCGCAGGHRCAAWCDCTSTQGLQPPGQCNCLHTNSNKLMKSLHASPAALLPVCLCVQPCTGSTSLTHPRHSTGTCQGPTPAAAQTGQSRQQRPCSKQTIADNVKTPHRWKQLQQCTKQLAGCCCRQREPALCMGRQHHRNSKHPSCQLCSRSATQQPTRN